MASAYRLQSIDNVAFGARGHFRFVASWVSFFAVLDNVLDVSRTGLQFMECCRRLFKHIHRSTARAVKGAKNKQTKRVRYFD
jgi:hypothetical protein